jgi:DNA-binding HxlR family transcriptional regulator
VDLWQGYLILERKRAKQKPHHFNELLASIPGVSDRLLTECLRELEAKGIVVHQVEDGPRVRVCYQLTDAGYALQGILDALAAWGHQWLSSEPEAAP